MVWRRRVFFGIVLLAVSWVSWATGVDAPVRSKIYRVEIDLGADGKSTETYSFRTAVLNESGVGYAKRFGFSYSASIQQGEILEAYTEKPDGRKIVAPADNYQTEFNDGRAGARPMFSDRNRISVVLPDVSVGDEVFVRYRIVNKEAIFPGHFSWVQTYSPYQAYDDAQLVLRSSLSQPLRIEAHHVQAEPVREQGGERHYVWKFSNPKAKIWNDEDEGILRMDERPSILISSFASYEDIAQAYATRAAPKAEPTDRVRALAKEIVGQESKKEAQARLLYHWVSKNITYGGNCIGVGAVVPRDLDQVLDNRMGDCKDHATLLQALLSASEIRSEQVLINAGDLYDLPKTPVVSLVNHVMNYLPDQKLYLDATAKDIPFGYLPESTYAKPVIHVRSSDALAKVPDSGHVKNEQRLQMRLKLIEGAKASGEISVQIKGLAAARVRASLREMTGDAERNLVRMALSGMGYRGRGTVDRGDMESLGDVHSFRMTFEIDNFLEGGASGAMVPRPVISTPMPVMTFAGAQSESEPKRRHACHGFHSYETLEFELPAGMELIAIPPSLRIRSLEVDYAARYAKTKNGLRVEREVHDKTATSICTPEQGQALHRQAVKIAENLNTQLLYRRKSR